MFACMSSAISPNALVFDSLSDVQKWLDVQPLDTIEGARIWKLDINNAVRIRVATVYVTEG